GLLIGGATWVNDPARGTVVDLDGVDDAIAIDPDLLELDTFNAFTISVWVQSDIGIGVTQDIATWWRWTGYPCTDCAINLAQHSNGRYRFEIAGTSVEGGTSSTSWTHIAATYDGFTMRLYVGGVQVGSVARSGALPASTADLLFGGQGNGTNDFDGRMDQIDVYAEALGPAEIAALAAD
ncbi:MAG: LamG domain-containing protein, partial [Planctomycetes bacterium]|nr:LamG domain-containing protein [Planctomycetota bacterium]